MGNDDLRWLTSAIGATATEVVAALRSEPGLVVDDDLLVQRFGIKRRLIDQVLWPAIELGALRKHRAGQSIVYKLDTRLRAPSEPEEVAPPPAAASATPSPSAQRRPGSPRANRLPPLDLAAISPVRKDVPPPSISGKGRSVYADLIDSLTETGMSRDGIPVGYRAALSHAAHTLGKISGRRYSVRVTSPTTCGIWRMA